MRANYVTGRKLEEGRKKKDEGDDRAAAYFLKSSLVLLKDLNK